MRKYIPLLLSAVMLLLFLVLFIFKPDEEDPSIDQNAVSQDNRSDYFPMIKFKNKYYYEDGMRTIKKPDKEAGKINTLVNEGKLPTENNQTNRSELDGAKLYINENEPHELYVYYEKHELEYLPIYVRYIEGKMTYEDIEDSRYVNTIMYRDKLYESENARDQSIRLKESEQKEVGIIDTCFQSAPGGNFSTNIFGLVGGKLYEDSENPNILYTEYRDEAGQKKEGEYNKYIYKEKRSNLRRVRFCG